MNDTCFRFLVVDDDPEIRGAYSDLLAKYAGEVDMAADGEDAFTKAQQRPYHLYITDILMPGISGFDFIARLRRIDPNAVIIIISGTDDVNYSMKALEFGAWRYLIKPVHRDTFFEMVTLGLKECVRRMPPQDQKPLLDMLQQTMEADHVPAPAVPKDIPLQSIPEIPAGQTTRPQADALRPDTDITAFRERLQQIKDDEIADFSRQLIEMKIELLRDTLHQLEEMRDHLLPPRR